MKRNVVVAAVVWASVGISSMAFAQGYPNGPGGSGPNSSNGPAHPGGPQYQGEQPRPGSMVGHNGGGIQNPSMARQPGNPGRPPMQANGGSHANGPREWHRGDRVPNDYRNRQYVVDDYRGYGLSRPQRGYQWIGVNGDYALVAIASGVIAQIVVNGR